MPNEKSPQPPMQDPTVMLSAELPSQLPSIVLLTGLEGNQYFKMSRSYIATRDWEYIIPTLFGKPLSNYFETIRLDISNIKNVAGVIGDGGTIYPNGYPQGESLAGIQELIDLTKGTQPSNPVQCADEIPQEGEIYLFTSEATVTNTSLPAQLRLLDRNTEEFHKLINQPGMIFFNFHTFDQ